MKRELIAALAEADQRKAAADDVLAQVIPGIREMAADGPAEAWVFVSAWANLTSQQRVAALLASALLRLAEIEGSRTE